MIDNSPFQDYPHPDDHTTRSTVTPGFKPFTVLMLSVVQMTVTVPTSVVSSSSPLQTVATMSPEAKNQMGKFSTVFVFFSFFMFSVSKNELHKTHPNWLRGF